MRRMTLVSVAVFLVVLVGASPAMASHVPTNILAPRTTHTGTALLSVGDIQWVSNVAGGRGVAAPFGELQPFERDGRRYMVASDSVYGLTIIDVTAPKAPVAVSTYASTFGCPTPDAEYVGSSGTGNPNAVFGTAFNAALGAVGWENDLTVTPDGTIAIIGMDAPGRCHDPLYGGIELVDISDVTNPRPLHLVRNVGFAHSVGIDPYHPWLAWVSTSDADDFVDVVDFRTCLGGVANITACKPEVGRIPFTLRQYPQLRSPTDPTRDIVGDGCHDTRFLATRAYCAAIDTTIIIDTTKIAGATLAENAPLSGTRLTAGTFACPVIDATRAPGVKVTDCSGWSRTAWEDRKGAGLDAPIRSVIVHNATGDPTKSIEISHQAEPIDGGKILAITDERGGGLNEGTPACPGGGVWFYDIRDDANPKLMKTPAGGSAVFISEHTVDSPFSCTVHYGEQFGDEPVLTFGWYTGGTHVLRIEPNYATSPATIGFDEIAAITPIGSMAIQAKPIGRDPDDPDRFIVYVADAARGIDVFSVAWPRSARVLSSRTTSTTGGGKLNDRVLPSADRHLPKTGVLDPSIGVGLLGMAAGLSARMRRRRF